MSANMLKYASAESKSIGIADVLCIVEPETAFDRAHPGAPVSQVGPAMMSLFERLHEADDPLSLPHIDASFSLAELLELCGAYTRQRAAIFDVGQGFC